MGDATLALKVIDKAEACNLKHKRLLTRRGRTRGRGRSGVGADHVGHKGVLAGENRVFDWKHGRGEAGG